MQIHILYNIYNTLKTLFSVLNFSEPFKSCAKFVSLFVYLWKLRYQQSMKRKLKLVILVSCVTLYSSIVFKNGSNANRCSKTVMAPWLRAFSVPITKPAICTMGSAHTDTSSDEHIGRKGDCLQGFGGEGGGSKYFSNFCC